MRDVREYLRPESVEEAIALKQARGASAAYLAGGSDLIVHGPSGVDTVIDIGQCGLNEVHRGAGFAVDGAARLCTVEAGAGEVCGGMLRAAVRETAPWLVRNSATLAGNVANASPAADSVPALVALDAELILDGDESTPVSVLSVLAGPHRTTLGDRLITRIRIPERACSATGRFIKWSRSKSDIAQVNVAVVFAQREGRVYEARIALGAVAPTAMRAQRAERLLEGQEPTAELLAQVQHTVEEEVAPISDWRASADYRRRISGVLVRRAIEDLLRATGGEMPA